MTTIGTATIELENGQKTVIPVYEVGTPKKSKSGKTQSYACGNNGNQGDYFVALNVSKRL